MDVSDFLHEENAKLKAERHRLEYALQNTSKPERLVEETFKIEDRSNKMFPLKKYSSDNRISSMASKLEIKQQRSLPASLKVPSRKLGRHVRKIAESSTDQDENVSPNLSSLLEFKQLKKKDTIVQNTLVADADPKSKNRYRKRQNVMEQWVSDTFYSYFPGFNNEYKNRQNILRARQNRNQQNFLKHQMFNGLESETKNEDIIPQMQLSTNNASTSIIERSSIEETKSSSSPKSNNKTKTHVTDKTDLEIIVNNPDYVLPKSAPTTVQPSITRNKLLQDLGHTALSNIVSGEGVPERNRRHAEVVSARKKDYQRELMQQIEEKRRSIELLREKEQKQEEASSRRLQEQIKTIQLEDELEKGRLQTEKHRLNAEHNHLMRDQLLTRLDMDKKILYANQVLNQNKSFSKKSNTTQKSQHHKNIELPKIKPATTTNDLNYTSCSAVHTNTSSTDNSNKVYKYFSNSAYRRRGLPLPDIDIDVSFEQPSKYLHPDSRECPLCNTSLRKYESFCLRCQQQLSFDMEVTPRQLVDLNGNDMYSRAISVELSQSRHLNNYPKEVPSALKDCSKHSYSVVCVKCTRLYALCPECLENSAVCRTCHLKRNVCMNCRRTLCSICLEDYACDRSEDNSDKCLMRGFEHFNADDKAKMQMELINRIHKTKQPFQVLDVNYATQPDIDGLSGLTSPSQLSARYTPSSPPAFQASDHKHMKEDENYTVPYSKTMHSVPIINATFRKDEPITMDRVRKDTERRLSRYIKNYGDLVTKKKRSKSESRSTQTTPDSTARRDIVLREEHNLAIPLLREMPKMTRKGTYSVLVDNTQDRKSKIDDLKRRWEVPAVQKLTKSETSPRILTQIGAIRKELQAQYLMEDGDY